MSSIIEKISFIFLLCFFVVSVTGCEDKAEKRAKLFAQIEKSQKDYEHCLSEAYINREDFLSKCKDEKKIVDDLKKQLDELNGVK